MVLIDAGCEYNGYASDITRTFPASGVFSQPQRDLYVAVLAAQKELIPLCTEESNLSLNDLHRKSVEFLRRELLQIGFDISMMSGDMNVLYPHFLSHPIGIDLHNSTNFERAGRLKAGMVVTIEPGLYVPPAAQFPKHFHGLGVRIEDEVLVGQEHATVLSAEAPKEISDVEGACQGLLGFEPY
ncbi:peptidase M24 [Punctularia strigosozonata HHB-11173 SS5]|uniref:Peptidase M24 n=1 Tax=Punctularia strigosozonata (strain HHB-11173) TaxID=741275 RepID=R7S3M0_PUNST|nr:peptidase M24 [Punctularia strigosozonata HHB-11173 SS5]EIN05000.1 peptidase M24 [Punctularia strigosozonata HHB-11173 SS5]